MTMKPKARKFRIRRSTPLQAAGLAQPARTPRSAASGQTTAAGAAAGPEAAQETAQETAQNTAPRQGADATDGGSAAAPRSGQVDTAAQTRAENTIDAIRREGLTGRQLRMARRVAQKHGLAPTSDFDAVRLLRARGIDPFQRGNLLELVTADGRTAQSEQPQGRDDQVHLPQTVPAGRARPELPSTELSPADRRAEEITRIQHDIARRRRRRLALLATRLFAFVLLPTLLAGYYFTNIATPMYSSKSAFLILTADGSSIGGSGGLGGLLPSQFATGQDAIATQEYLESKDAMLRLDKEQGYRVHFSQPWIDPLQRLSPDASNEGVYKHYNNNVKLGYDPTEGIIRMEVTAATPEAGKRFSKQLIAYAEERVDHLSQEKRLDAVKTAAESLEQAKADRRAAQRRLVTLQESSILDPEGEIAGIRQLISNVELQLQEKELGLNMQLNNSRPNQAKVDALRSEVEVLRTELQQQRKRLTEATSESDSLASQSAAIKMAQADLATADLVLQSALETKRQAQIEANKQVRYLTVSAQPVAAQDPSYPRAFENTVLAFLIFAGIYLMISLTVSILREQVSS